MEKDKITKLFTTTLWNFNDKPLLYFETRLDDKSGKILSLGRTINHILRGGKIYREFNPVIKLLNNTTAKILQFKRKDVEDDSDRRKNNSVGDGQLTD